jgi:hypothetical protein
MREWSGEQPDSRGVLHLISSILSFSKPVARDMERICRRCKPRAARRLIIKSPSAWFLSSPQGAFSL